MIFISDQQKAPTAAATAGTYSGQTLAAAAASIHPAYCPHRHCHMCCLLLVAGLWVARWLNELAGLQSLDATPQV